MNLRHLSALALAATLSVSAPLFAASQPESTSAYGIRILTATSGGGIPIQRGTDRGEVAFALRNSVRKTLASDVWVYRGFHAENADSDAVRACDTVVITFVHDKVARMQLVSAPGLALIAANLKHDYSRDLASK